jgi:hypothetical protein
MSIFLCIFANTIRFADLVDNTCVSNLKQFYLYQNKSIIRYNIVWFLITFIFWLLSKDAINY